MEPIIPSLKGFRSDPFGARRPREIERFILIPAQSAGFRSRPLHLAAVACLRIAAPPPIPHQRWGVFRSPFRCRGSPSQTAHIGTASAQCRCNRQTIPVIPESWIYLTGQMGNTCPFPDSCGGAFPFLLTSMGTPLHTYNLRSEITGSTHDSGYGADPEGCGFIHNPYQTKFHIY